MTFNRFDRAFGGCPSTLASRNERPSADCTCRVDYLSFTPLIRENLFIFNTTERSCYAIHVKLDEVYCKLQNYIYLLTCKLCGIQYVDESITSLNLRMKIQEGSETFIKYYKNV